MGNDECVIIFTKDRQTILLKTVQEFLHTGLEVILIDDSTTQTTRKIFGQIKLNNFTYHGKVEQQALLKYFVDKKSLYPFLRQLGLKEWNLGFVRNYALILSKIYGFKKVLFVDDDIIVQDVTLIKKILMRLDYVDFVGSKVIGMPDDSVVGHLMRACGGKYYEFLSGGFLAFNINKISEYFINFYNEDQIWFFLHPATTKYEIFGEVTQEQYDPFRNVVLKALRQEFGEILDEGAEKAFYYNDSRLLITEDFWKGICSTRIEYLNQLKDLSVSKEIESTALKVHNALMDYYSKISYNALSKVFIDYFSQRDEWKNILNFANELHLNHAEITYV